MRNDLLTSYFLPLGGEPAAEAPKLTRALAVDGVGDLKPPVSPAVLVTTDTVPDAPDTAGSGNPVLAVTPPGTTTPIVSAIDTLGDQDVYRVTLTAGVAYEFGLYSYTGGPNLVGLTDPYLELYAPDGSTLVVSADGGADTPYNAINSGFDVLLTYTPTASGTYYVNARAFSNSPLTSTGDSVGDYQLFARVQDPDDPSVYRPYYAPTEPLYAIDWGTQVDKVNTTARNPDGDEGSRATGNPQGSPTISSAFDVNALAAAQGVDIAGKNVITIYFAQAGDVFVSNDPTNPGLPPATITAVGVQDFERTAVLTSLAEFAKVADVVYLEVGDRDQADFVYTSYQGTPGPGISLLGSMSPPGESDEGLAQFNSGDYRWNATDLQQGGFSFVTLIHEFGHGHGLAHPHDNGGRSGIMNGVEQEDAASVADYTTGDFELNQGVFTMMSYEDGWQSSPYGNAPTDVGYGYLGGLMAFDIAAIQDKYGVNEEWATGNDVYVLKDVNAAGTYYTSIWDAGGTDAIVYAGSRDTTIDLRAATLAYEVGGGGRVSFATGVFGGFTIANGVTIENAASGAGRDVLIGNAGANVLNGGAGNDALDGGAGADWLEGGLGDDGYVVDNTGDVVREESAAGGVDTVHSSVKFSLGQHTENLTLTGVSSIAGSGNDLANVLTGNAANNLLKGGSGADTLFGGGGDDTLRGGPGSDSMNGGLGDDLYLVEDAGDTLNEAAGEGTDTVHAAFSFSLGADFENLVLLGTDAIDGSGNALANVLTGNAGANLLKGGAGADTLVGAAGNDVLNGGTGGDRMDGGSGDDLYHVDDAADLVYDSAGLDTIHSSVTLSLGKSIESLTLTGGAAINGSGNDLNNYLTGNAAANTLKGGSGKDLLAGGLGADTLNGGPGADKFLFDSALGGSNVDRIVDFASADDTIWLDRSVFGTLAAGVLDPGAFRAGTTALDADDRILFDGATGKIRYDADGSGAIAAITFALVEPGTALGSNDFFVVP